MTQKLLTGGLVLALAAVFLLGLYYLKCLKRMQKLLRDYQETGTAGFSTMKETQESKLENTLQRLLNQAEKKEVQAKKERDEVASLLSDLTHQLKTPMANVIMYTELLEDESLKAEERERFTHLAGTQAKKMQWLLENILDNAVKYSPSGSTVTVRVYPMELYTQIEITDQGIGIPRGEYNKIFQRFYRSGNAAQTQGSGLGLYLAQLILNNEKGYVTAVSRPGEGSSFRIFLLNEVLTVL